MITLTLATVVSGFIFININLFLFYKLHRYGSGWLLYLHCAKWGFVFLFLAMALNIALFHIFKIPTYCECEISYGFDYIQRIANFLKETFLYKNNSDFIEDSWILTTILIMFSLPYIVNALYRAWEMEKLGFDRKSELDMERYKLYLNYINLKESPMDKLIIESILDEQILLFSMKDRKVYVGMVNAGSECNEAKSANQEIVISPIMSGYRDENTLLVDFTTIYNLPQVDQSNEDETNKIDAEYSLTLKQDNINSINKFDFDVYLKIIEKNEEYWDQYYME